MDKFVNKYKAALQQNPNITNHLNNPNTKTKKRKNKISNYFAVTPNNSNSISIDCSSSDEAEDNDLDIIIIENDRNNQRNLQKRTQKSLKLFLKPLTNESREEKETQKQNSVSHYLCVEPLMNERHLLEMTQLFGLRNNGSRTRLKQSYFGKNLNSDLLYRRHLHCIIDSQSLHSLPIQHSLSNNGQMTQMRTDSESEYYISNVKFDRIGSLIAASSTNGKVQIFDFDKFVTKWNDQIRMEYNRQILSSNLKMSEIKHGSLHNISEIDFFVGFKIEDIEWSKHRLSEVSLCGHSFGSLNIYDLRLKSNKAKQRLQTGSSHPLLTLKYSNEGGLICAGDRMGYVHGWDLRQSSERNNAILKIDPKISMSHRSGVFGIGNAFVSHINDRRNNINPRECAVKHLHFAKNDNLLYIVRENGYIQIIDIRKHNGFVYKNIDLWRCQFVSENKQINKTNININHSHRARIDDAMICESMNSAILKLQNNALVNIHLGSERILKTFSFQNAFGYHKLKNEFENEKMKNVSFLYKVQQRRMCSFAEYGMPQIIQTGSFEKELNTIDMSSEFDLSFAEREYKQKRVDLGLLNLDNTNNNMKASEANINDLYTSKSYGFMGKTELRDIMTCCTLHPKSLYTVCGTLNNTLEIVACASNPF